MKKRMKLTEKELSIGMWLYVKLCIKYRDEAYLISMFKADYLDEHNMREKWTHSCILCSKHNHVCSICPLGSCSCEYKTLWSVVSNSLLHINADSGTYDEFPFTLEERLDACDKIIEAIEKDVPDDYVTPLHR